VRIVPPPACRLSDFGIDNFASYITSEKDVKNSPVPRTSAYDTAHHNGGDDGAGMPFLSKWICFGHGKALIKVRVNDNNTTCIHASIGAAIRQHPSIAVQQTPTAWRRT
jgi:hypothetical protein